MADETPNLDKLRACMTPVADAFARIRGEAEALADAAMRNNEHDWRTFHVSVEILREELARFAVSPIGRKK